MKPGRVRCSSRRCHHEAPRQQQASRASSVDASSVPFLRVPSSQKVLSIYVVECRISTLGTTNYYNGLGKFGVPSGTPLRAPIPDF